MSDYDPHAIEEPAGRPAAAEITATAMPRRSPAALCGRAAGPVELVPANQNVPADEDTAADEVTLFAQLPAVIRGAIDEWAVKLMAQPWRFRREIMGHFAKIFADQFRAHSPGMSDEAYEGLKEIGFTCLLERMDDGRPVADLHQARIYLESVHDHHKCAAHAFLGRTTPHALPLN